MAYSIFTRLPERAQKMWFEYCAISNRSNCKTNLDYICEHLDVLEEYSNTCKSPIELIFALAFELVAYDAPEGKYLWLEPQYEVDVGEKKYYLDFSCEGFSTLKVGVECDGHDFHEKTKEQVARDNERDYNLKMAGWDILHFSGSQIYKEPFKCAYKTIEYIISKQGE